MSIMSPGAKFRAAMKAEKPLQCVGAINAYHARLAERGGYKSIYLSGGGVAAGSLGLPDLGISNLEDVLTDVRRITDVCTLPLLVDTDTGFGASAFNIARTVKSLIKSGAAAMHIEDQVGAKRCGHRPGKELVPKEEMVDRIKAAVDAKTDADFVVMARTDALAVEGLERAIDRALACVDAGADAVFPEAIPELFMYRKFADAVKVPVLANITSSAQRRFSRSRSCAPPGSRSLSIPLGVPRHERGGAQGLQCDPQGGNAEGRRRPDADARRSLRGTRLSRLRAQARPIVRQRESEMSEAVTAPKPKKSVALSGVPAGNTALCTVGRSGNDLHYAVTTSSISPTRRSSRKSPTCSFTRNCRLPRSSRPTRQS